MSADDPILFEAQARGYPLPGLWTCGVYTLVGIQGLVILPLVMIAMAISQNATWELGWGVIGLSPAGGTFYAVAPSPFTFLFALGFLELCRLASARSERYELRASGLTVSRGLLWRRSRTHRLQGLALSPTRGGLRGSFPISGRKPKRHERPFVLKGLDAIDAESLQTPWRNSRNVGGRGG